MCTFLTIFSIPILSIIEITLQNILTLKDVRNKIKTVWNMSEKTYEHPRANILFLAIEMKWWSCCYWSVIGMEVMVIPVRRKSWASSNSSFAWKQNPTFWVPIHINIIWDMAPLFSNEYFKTSTWSLFARKGLPQSWYKFFKKTYIKIKK